MASLSLSNTAEILPCPACGQTINTSMAQCPYCAAPVDALAAQASAAQTSRISAACSDASYLKVMAWAILMFLGLSFAPFLGLVGGAGLWFLRFAIPFMSARWWIRYGALRSPDPDLARARRIAIIVSAVAVVLLLDLLYISLNLHRT